MSRRPLLVLDVETNGRDVEQHSVWEMAWWNLDTGERDSFLPFIDDGRDFLYGAELDALRINHFVDRWTDDFRTYHDYSAHTAKMKLRDFLDQCWPVAGDKSDRAVTVCAQPKFDLPFASKTLLTHDVPCLWGEPVDRWQPWFHRAIDFESWVGAAFGLSPRNPESASACAARLGVTVPEEQRHTAAGDVTLVGRSMLVLDWINRQGPSSPKEFNRLLDDAPQGDEIDKLIEDS